MVLISLGKDVVSYRGSLPRQAVLQPRGIAMQSLIERDESGGADLYQSHCSVTGFRYGSVWQRGDHKLGVLRDRET